MRSGMAATGISFNKGTHGCVRLRRTTRTRRRTPQELVKVADQRATTGQIALCLNECRAMALPCRTGRERVHPDLRPPFPDDIRFGMGAIRNGREWSKGDCRPKRRPIRVLQRLLRIALCNSAPLSRWLRRALDDLGPAAPFVVLIHEGAVDGRGGQRRSGGSTSSTSGMDDAWVMS